MLHHQPNDKVVELKRHQWEAWQNDARFQVRVWHRRAGKTFYTILKMLARIEEEGRGDWQAFYVAPTRLQARQITWPYLAEFSQALNAELYVSDLKCVIPGKGFIQLHSGELFDRMRGLYADDVTIDEAADVPRAAWTEVISPMISDRKGRVTFMGTPRGRMNLLWDVYEMATSGEPDWHASLLTANDTGMIDAEELERNRRQQSEPQFNQEWMCAWDGATQGAYYGKIMADLTADGRVCPIQYDDALPVFAAIDLGHHDLMPVVFAQPHGNQFRIFHCKTYQFTGLPDVIKDIRKMPWPLDRLIAPHDVKVTELGSGQTRLQTLRNLGVDVRVAPKLSLDEGIEQTRQFLKRCWFDSQNTRHLREGLSQYRSDYDELRGVFRLKPIHDESSHYADAMRYLATGDNRVYDGGGQRPDRGALGVYA